MKGLLGLAAALALGGCSAIHLSVPADTAQTVTTVSKQTVIAANDLYVHGVNAGAVLVQKGIITQAAYRKVSYDAYQILLKVRVGTATLAQLSTALIPLQGAE